MRISTGGVAGEERSTDQVRQTEGKMKDELIGPYHMGRAFAT